VSYEYREYGISYEQALGGSLLTLRHGGISLLNGKGYYSARLLGSTTETLTRSEKNYEPSFGVELRLPSLRSRQLVTSVDIRDRLQYSFHRSAGAEEQRRMTWTIAFGLSSKEGDRGFLRSVFGYYTHGVNPFGQLREQYPYWAGGLGWVFQ